MEHDLLQVIPAGAPGRYRLVGELDVGSVDRARQVLRAEVAAGVAPPLDLSGLSFMDSQGVRLLIDLGAMAQTCGLAVVVERLSPAARRVLEVTLPGGIPGVEFLG